MEEKINRIEITLADIATKVSSTSARLESVATKLDSTSTRLDAVSAKLNTTADKLDSVVTKLDTVSGKVDKMSTKLNDVVATQADFSVMLTGIVKRLDNVDRHFFAIDQRFNTTDNMVENLATATLRGFAQMDNKFAYHGLTRGDHEKLSRRVSKLERAVL